MSAQEKNNVIEIDTWLEEREAEARSITAKEQEAIEARAIHQQQRTQILPWPLGLLKEWIRVGRMWWRGER